MCDVKIYTDTSDFNPYKPTCYKHKESIKCIIDNSKLQNNSVSRSNNSSHNSSMLTFEPQKCKIKTSNNIKCTSMNNNICTINGKIKAIEFSKK